MKRLVAVIVLVAALAVGASAANARTANRWPAAAEHSFLVNCYATSNGMVRACRCSLHWLEQRYTYRQITTIYLNDQAHFRRIVRAAAIACR